MYIINKKMPYFIDSDNKIFKVSFGDDGKIIVGEEEKDLSNNKNYVKYSYDEIRAKFNVEYMIQKKKEEKQKEELLKDYVKEYVEKIKILEEENNKLKSEIEKLSSDKKSEEKSKENK